MGSQSLREQDPAARTAWDPAARTVILPCTSTNSHVVVRALLGVQLLTLAAEVLKRKKVTESDLTLRIGLIPQGGAEVWLLHISAVQG